MNRSARLKQVAKSDKEPITAGLRVPPTEHRGRPKGSLNKKTLALQATAKGLTKVVDDRIVKSFGKMVDDAEKSLVISEPDFDGGGTKENAPVVSKESLERRVTRRLNVLDRYLTDDRLLSLLDQSGLKEVGIYEGIMMDKALVLKGQPTVIVGSADRTAMDDLMPRLLAEARRRKLITSVSERKIAFTSPGGDSGDTA